MERLGSGSNVRERKHHTRQSGKSRKETTEGSVSKRSGTSKRRKTTVLNVGKLGSLTNSPDKKSGEDYKPKLGGLKKMSTKIDKVGKHLDAFKGTTPKQVKPTEEVAEVNSSTTSEAS